MWEGFATKLTMVLEAFFFCGTNKNIFESNTTKFSMKTLPLYAVVRHVNVTLHKWKKVLR